ncbi:MULTISPECIES: SpaH/EbpB family LPXTG-anchored major pilin [unclassified Leucobacter]|uniref:SpaH/EbpB family LPXTG-anchored major pilin n=1 Tax=unclassified Leucobacter TaxID=2621730 RepID=UPI00165DCF79|nr:MULTISPECIES: SpaH/EbpB family LPXTG-anchored major pilin [unclassified Leucobacter]MBC9935789.1 SpaH/EbpB family LPXTG-anchored major pilin [Leucobacter sp. cx-87]
MAERKMMRRGAAMLGATVLGMVALLGANTTANAAPLPGDYGNIDFDRMGSLTVHKYLHQSGTVTGDISAPPASDDFTDPVAGVVFTAYPLLKDGSALDLSVAANWTGLKTVTPGAGCTAPAGFTLGTAVVLPATDAAGAAAASLPIGAYQICETAAPAEIIDRALPFILTIPMPHETGWVYDVHAYPKNGKGEIIKSIDPQLNTGLGSVISFPVSVVIPTSADVWTGFAIRDTLDSRLTPVTAANTAVTLGGAALDPSLYTVTVTGQQVTMNFNAAGIEWLNLDPKNVQAGKTIQVVFAGTVTSVGDGVIKNTAVLWPNNPGFDPAVRPPLPSNEVKSNWGDLQVQKRAAGTTGAQGTLNGAVFEVYNAVAPYAASCTGAVQTGSAITVNGATQFTSEGTGLITIPGLFVSDNVNPTKDALQRCYVLKEVAAPAGFVLPANPYTAVTVKIDATTIADNVQISNTQQEVPELPLTGAAGQVLLIAGGAAAVAVAMGLVLMNRRREAASN